MFAQTSVDKITLHVKKIKLGIKKKVQNYRQKLCLTQTKFEKNEPQAVRLERTPRPKKTTCHRVKRLI